MIHGCRFQIARYIIFSGNSRRIYLGNRKSHSGYYLIFDSLIDMDIIHNDLSTVFDFKAPIIHYYLIDWQIYSILFYSIWNRLMNKSMLTVSIYHFTVLKLNVLHGYSTYTNCAPILYYHRINGELNQNKIKYSESTRLKYYLRVQ